MNISCLSNLKEFGFELAKALGKRAAPLVPIAIGYQIGRLAGIGQPIATLMGRISNLAIIGAGCHSAAKLTRCIEATSHDRTWLGQARNMLNIGASIAIAANTVYPVPLTAVVLSTIGGIVNVCEGMQYVKLGAQPSEKKNWRDVAEGIVSVGFGAFQLLAAYDYFHEYPSSKPPRLSNPDDTCSSDEAPFRNHTVYPLPKLKVDPEQCLPYPEEALKRRRLGPLPIPNLQELPLDSECTYSLSSENSLGYACVERAILEQDSTATSTSIQDFFYSAMGRVEEIFDEKECAVTGGRYVLDSYTSPQFDPSELIDRFPEEMIKLYQFRDRDGSRLYHNLFQSIDRIWCLGRCCTQPQPSDINEISKTLTGYHTRQLDFAFHLLSDRVSGYDPKAMLIHNIMKSQFPKNPLFLRASWDHNGAFGPPLPLQTVNSTDHVCSRLKAVTQSTGQLIDSLFINVHGNSQVIKFSEEEGPVGVDRLSKMAACIQETVQRNATIALLSCSTGANNFAQTLATKSGRIVMAPATNLRKSACTYSFTGDHPLSLIWTCQNITILTFQPAGE